MKELARKKDLALNKCEERKLKIEILRIYLPFRFAIKFNKLIVLLCIAAIFVYTVAAILLQRNTTIEISPTLTTCVFAFFGTELLGLAGIKITDTKFNNTESENTSDNDAVG